jgi:hypothetical protein
MTFSSSPLSPVSFLFWPRFEFMPGRKSENRAVQMLVQFEIDFLSKVLFRGGFASNMF